MTLERAIDILVQHVTRAWPANDPDLRIAEELGIEALERLRENRQELEFDHWRLLRHETEEVS